MTRIASISVFLFVIVAAAAQSSMAPMETEVCTAEDYAISTVALNDLFAKQKPDRVLLRNRTFVRLRATDATTKSYFGTCRRK
jgi:hypothetical protein